MKKNKQKSAINQQQSTSYINVWLFWFVLFWWANKNRVWLLIVTHDFSSLFHRCVFLLQQLNQVYSSYISERVFKVFCFFLPDVFRRILATLRNPAWDSWTKKRLNYSSVFPSADAPQESGGVSHHRRHQRRDLRVHGRVRHDLRRIQLEAELPLVPGSPEGDGSTEGRPDAARQVISARGWARNSGKAEDPEDVSPISRERAELKLGQRGRGFGKLQTGAIFIWSDLFDVWISLKFTWLLFIFTLCSPLNINSTLLYPRKISCVFVIQTNQSVKQASINLDSEFKTESTDRRNYALCATLSY